MKGNPTTGRGEREAGFLGFVVKQGKT